MKKLLKGLLVALLICAVAAGAYVAYVYISLGRLEDNIVLSINNGQSEKIASGCEYTIASYNVGFGAYSADFGFFMDGGEESRARSAEEVCVNIGGALSVVKELSPDIALFQEVDIKGDRSRDVDERALITAALPSFSWIFAQTYDSPYLLYPLTQPIGSAVSGIMTMTSLSAESSVRRRLPIEKGLIRVLDLDRCYSVTRMPVEGGGELVVYNVHLSAYTSDGSIVDEQLRILLSDMTGERAAGNYVICGGDFNCDLLGDSPSVFGVDGKDVTWARPFKKEMLPEGFALVAPYNADDPKPSGRNADGAYVEGMSFVITLDGFIVSDNVSVIASDVRSTGFKYSDHDPVYMKFELIENE